MYMGIFHSDFSKGKGASMHVSVSVPVVPCIQVCILLWTAHSSHCCFVHINFRSAELCSPLEVMQPCSVVLCSGSCLIFSVLRGKNEDESTKPKFSDWWLNGYPSSHLLRVTKMHGLGAVQMQHTEMKKAEEIHGQHHIACLGLSQLNRMVKIGLFSFLCSINHLILDLILKLVNYWLMNSSEYFLRALSWDGQLPLPE